MFSAHTYRKISFKTSSLTSISKKKLMCLDTSELIYSPCECVNNSGNIVVSLEILSDFVNNM